MDTLAYATRVSMMSRPRYRATPSLDTMRRAPGVGTPLRLADLAALTGFSKPKLIADIRNGYLVATRARCAGRYMWLVPFAEAQRYLRSLGLL